MTSPQQPSYHMMVTTSPTRETSESDSTATGLNAIDNTTASSTTANAPSALDASTDTTGIFDTAVEAALGNEVMLASGNANTIETTRVNPYQNWVDAFGFIGHFDARATIPTRKLEFIEAVNREILRIGHIQNHFLSHQNDASQKTIDQLSQISSDLQGIVVAVGVVENDGQEVRDDLREAFSHALLWIKRTRAILISCHVFYKVNYVLGSNPINPPV